MMSVLGDKIPKLIAGVETRALPLSAVDGFVMSRIDGISNARDIGDSTGIGMDAALESLQRLVEHGVAEFIDAEPTAEHSSGANASGANTSGANASPLNRP